MLFVLLFTLVVDFCVVKADYISIRLSIQLLILNLYYEDDDDINSLYFWFLDVDLQAVLKFEGVSCSIKLISWELSSSLSIKIGLCSLDYSGAGFKIL